MMLKTITAIGSIFMIIQGVTNTFFPRYHIIFPRQYIIAVILGTLALAMIANISSWKFRYTKARRFQILSAAIFSVLAIVGFLIPFDYITVFNFPLYYSDILSTGMLLELFFLLVSVGIEKDYPKNVDWERTYGFERFLLFAISLCPLWLIAYMWIPSFPTHITISQYQINTIFVAIFIGAVAYIPLIFRERKAKKEYKLAKEKESQSEQLYNGIMNTVSQLAELQEELQKKRKK